MNLLITVCARGGSKSIPYKNIKLLNGKPLISYTIKIAQNFCKLYNATIALSTNDEIILEVCRDFGLNESYVRPNELALDDTPKTDTIIHLLYYKEIETQTKFDYILDLDVTSPLRTLDDLKKAFLILLNNKKAFNLFSVRKALRNPYFNMVEKRKNGYVRPVKIPEKKIYNRQSAPAVFDLDASFYFYRRIFFQHSFKSVITPKSLVYIMPHISFDIDNNIDFEFMEYLIKTKKTGIKI